MTTLTNSPSISPKSFAVPTSRSHRGATSSSSSSGTSPFSRPLPRPSPRPSPQLYARYRDASPANPRRSIGSSAPLFTSVPNASSVLLASRTEQEVAPVPPVTTTSESKQTQTSPVLLSAATTGPTSTQMRDVGTQYTPDGLPPTAPRPLNSFSSLSEQAQAMAYSHDSLRTFGSSSSGDVFMTDLPSSTEVSGTPLRAAQSSSALQKTDQASGESQVVADGNTAQPDGEVSNAQNIRAPKRTDVASDGSEQSPDLATNTSPSSAKKSKTSMPGAKVMPDNYMDCNLRELGIIISDMLMELIRLNDEIPPREGSLTRFHSRAPPTISVRDYLNRLIVHATLSAPLLLTIVFYIDRLCTLYPAFTISSLTVHRFLITAATVAAKGLSDSFWTNHTYARVGGVSTKELAMLELDFLGRLDWTIVPRPDTLEDYYRSLIGRADGYVLEGSQKEG